MKMILELQKRITTH